MSMDIRQIRGLLKREKVYSEKATAKKDFLNRPESLHWKRDIIINAIVCYCLAGFNLVFGGVYSGEIPFIDVFIIGALGLFLHFKQSRVAAIILLAYAILSTLLVYLETGIMEGWLWILVGVSAVFSTFRIEKAWKEYKSD